MSITATFKVEDIIEGCFCDDIVVIPLPDVCSLVSPSNIMTRVSTSALMCENRNELVCARFKSLSVSAVEILIMRFNIFFLLSFFELFEERFGVFRDHLSFRFQLLLVRFETLVASEIRLLVLSLLVLLTLIKSLL